MSDTTALQDQALAAAASVLGEISDLIPVALHGAVRSALAIAWIEGRQAGGLEAQAVIRSFLEGLK